jgi:hypothetical protein
MLDNNGRNVESLCKITYLPMTWMAETCCKK